MARGLFLLILLNVVLPQFPHAVWRGGWAPTLAPQSPNLELQTDVTLTPVKEVGSHMTPSVTEGL